MNNSFEPLDKDQTCEGTVTAVDNGLIQIHLSNNTQCASCIAEDSCTLHSNQRTIAVAASGMAKGDRVRLHVSRRIARSAAVVLFLIPTLLIITGAFAGYTAGPEFFGINADLGGFAGITLGIAISWLFVHFYRAGPSSHQPIIRVEKVD